MKKKEYLVPNLEKGVAVLEYIARYPEGCRLSDVKKGVDVSQTSLYRILNTLVTLNYLTYSESNKKYFITRKLLALGFQSLRENSLIDIVMPRMKELRDKIKEPVFFGVMGVDKVVFIEQVASIHPFSFTIRPGHKMHLHTAAPGKAMMAYYKIGDLTSYLDKIEFIKFTENTITTREEYIKELEKVRKLGYAVDNEEELRGVVCIAAPLFNYNGNICGTIWSSAPKDRLNGSFFNECAVQIVECAKRISEDLGCININQ